VVIVNRFQSPVVVSYNYKGFEKSNDLQLIRKNQFTGKAENPWPKSLQRLKNRHRDAPLLHCHPEMPIIMV